MEYTVRISCTPIGSGKEVLYRLTYRGECCDYHPGFQKITIPDTESALQNVFLCQPNHQLRGGRAGVCSSSPLTPPTMLEIAFFRQLSAGQLSTFVLRNGK